MQFEVVHEFDIPLDALELAVISPNLFQELSKRLHSIESVSQKEHVLTDSCLERLWSYRANVKIPAFATKYVTPEMCAWDEKSTYDIKKHVSEWTILPHVKPEWRKMFTAFRHRNYRLFFIGQLISLIGNWVNSTAEGWLVYQLTGSTALLGVVAAASTGPMLFLSTWGGWVADRHPKRTVLVIAQVASAAAA